MTGIVITVIALAAVVAVAIGYAAGGRSPRDRIVDIYLLGRKPRRRDAREG